jgi:DNA-binding transcriptional LysR family regulator
MNTGRRQTTTSVTHRAAQTKDGAMLNAAVPLDTDSKAMCGATANLRLVEPSPTAVGLASLGGRSHSFFTPAKLEAFVAVAEEGGFSAAARRLCISQPALSQTINAIERRLGVELFVRSTTGAQSTEAGRALLDEARAILAGYDQLLPAMARYTGEGGGVIRLGIPYELASEVLCALAKFAVSYPDTRVQPRHLPMAEHLAALRSSELDVSFMVQIPPGPDLDNMLVAREDLGVLLSEELAARLAGPDGVRLDALTGLDWVAFPRSNSPAWYDELAAVLRTHGIDVGPADRGDQFPNLSVAFTALICGNAFALAPQRCTHAIPHAVAWRPLADHPVVRSTWAVWPAGSRRRDVARLITAFEQPTRRQACSSTAVATSEPCCNPE